MDNLFSRHKYIIKIPKYIIMKLFGKPSTGLNVLRGNWFLLSSNYIQTAEIDNDLNVDYFCGWNADLINIETISGHTLGTEDAHDIEKVDSKEKWKQHNLSFKLRLVDDSTSNQLVYLIEGTTSVVTLMRLETEEEGFYYQLATPYSEYYLFKLNANDLIQDFFFTKIDEKYFL